MLLACEPCLRTLPTLLAWSLFSPPYNIDSLWQLRLRMPSTTIPHHRIHHSIHATGSLQMKRSSRNESLTRSHVPPKNNLLSLLPQNRDTAIGKTTSIRSLHRYRIPTDINAKYILRLGSIQVSTTRSYRRLFVNSSKSARTPKMSARQLVQAHLSGQWAFDVITRSRALSISESRLKRGIFTRSGDDFETRI